MKKIVISSLCSLLLFCTTVIGAQETPSQAVNYQKTGDRLLLNGDYKGSIAQFTKALPLFTQTKNYAKIAETYNQLARAYLKDIQLENALSAAENALKLSLEKIPDSKQQADALDLIGAIYLARGINTEDALNNHKNALKIRLNFYTDDRFSLASTYYHIGDVLHFQDKYDEALRYFNKALEINLNPEPRNLKLLSKINLAIGLVYFDRGEYDKAERKYIEVLDQAEKIYEENHPFLGDVYNRLGNMYAVKSEFNSSLNYYQKALNLSIANFGMDNHPEQIKLHYNIGTSYFTLGQKEKAQFHIQKTLHMGAKVYGENHFGMYFPYTLMGQIYGDERGISLTEKALRIAVNALGENHTRVAYVYECLAIIYGNIDKPKEGVKYALKALNIRLKSFGERSVFTLRSYNQVSELYRLLGDFKNALDYNAKAIAINTLQKKEASKKNNYTASTFFDVGEIYTSVKIKADIYFDLYNKSHKESDLKESERLYKETLQLMDLFKQGKNNIDIKLTLSEVTKRVHKKNIEVALLLNTLKKDAKFLEESFYQSEKSKASILLELLQQSDAKKFAGLPDEVLQEELVIKTNIAIAESDVVKELAKKKVDSAKLYKNQSRLVNLIFKKDSLESSLEKQFPAYYELKNQYKSVTISQLQEKLSSNTTIIEFFKSENDVFVFVISKNDFHVEKLTLENIDDEILAFYESIRTKDGVKYKQLGYRLYEKLIAPVKDKIVGDQLIIIPDESLWQLRFELLLSENSDDLPFKELPYLVKEYAISYVNSASFLFKKARRTNAQKLLNECLAFSYSDSISSIDPEIISLNTLRSTASDLPGTRKEIKEISNIVDGKYFYGVNANEANFKTRASKYGMIHLALHGELNNENPRDSKIFFSNPTNNSGKEDNVLYGHELYSMEIPANLVVISACNTGSGKINKGEGVLSLGSAFQYAGVNSLVLTDQEISDKTTPLIMKYFYKNLSDGMTKDKALQQAKLRFLNESDVFNSNPFYWGNFYIIGDVEAIPFENNTSVIWYLLISIVVLLILFRRRVPFLK